MMGNSTSVDKAVIAADVIQYRFSPGGFAVT